MSGRDLRQEPLSSRRAELEQSVYESDALILSRRLSANGVQAFGVAKRRGYEGLVAKPLASVYIEGRSQEWLKVKGVPGGRIHHRGLYRTSGFSGTFWRTPPWKILPGSNLRRSYRQNSSLRFPTRNGLKTESCVTRCSSVSAMTPSGIHVDCPSRANAKADIPLQMFPQGF